MPEYVVLGGSFRTRGGLLAGEYTGRVIGSRDAFYLVIYLNPAELSMAAGGGLLGAVGAAVTAGDAIKSEVTELSKLPEQVTSHPDWPVRPGRKDYPVVVVPREAVKKIRYSWWRTFDIVTEGQTLGCGCSVGGRSSSSFATLGGSSNPVQGWVQAGCGR